MNTTSLPERPQSRLKVLYLGISGVLHPSKSLYVLLRGIDPFNDGHAEYESADLLEELLEPWPDVVIVLTSTRPWRHGMAAVLAELGPGLAARVVGHTFEDLTTHARYGKMQRPMSEEDYWREGKAGIVAKHVAWLRPASWVALDDESYGWDAKALACRVVVTPGEKGLHDSDAQAKLQALLGHNFGGSCAQQRQLSRLTCDAAHVRQFAVEAAQCAAADVDPHPRVLALGLEGTLFAHLGSTVVARPFLHHFLDSCADLFDRIVVFYDHEFRSTAEQLIQRGLVPSWFADVDGIAWDGRLKDLERVGAFDLNEVLLVEDTTRFLKPGQEHRHLSVSTFNGAATDWDLLRVYESLEHVVKGGKDQAWTTNWPVA